VQSSISAVLELCIDQSSIWTPALCGCGCGATCGDRYDQAIMTSCGGCDPIALIVSDLSAFIQPIQV
jgi:hypothetical protein